MSLTNMELLLRRATEEKDTFLIDCANQMQKLLAQEEFATKEVKRLKQVIEGDRSIVAEIMQNVRKAIASRDWLMEGRGSYVFDDDTYRREFSCAIMEVEDSLNPLRKLSRDWSDCPVSSEEIALSRENRRKALLGGE